MAKRIRLDKETIGFIYIKSDLKDLYSRMGWLTGFMVLLIIGTSFLSYFLAIRFQRIITDPLLNLSQKMKKISLEKDYSVRAPVESKDEVGVLIEGFNDMLGQIQARDEDLKKYHAGLEEEIAQRTADLLTINQQLEHSVEELKKAKEMAESASQSKSDFLANMSHELRTPLNHILGFTELVVDKQCGDLNPDQEEYLKDVLQSGRHLLSLINDILDLAKVESGKMDLQATHLNLRVLMSNSLNMIKEKAQQHRIKIVPDIDGIPEFIKADDRKLKQILYNLLSNAVKFTPDGGSVRLGARKMHSLEVGMGNWKNPPNPPLTKGGEGEFIEISVEDTGIGIKQEDLQRIFDPFEQVESSTSRRYQGTGLGLSLTRNLVELHGGKIWAESEGAEKGSKFTFIIPV